MRVYIYIYIYIYIYTWHFLKKMSKTQNLCFDYKNIYFWHAMPNLIHFVGSDARGIYTPISSSTRCRP